jgi:SAM-dependent methyltransferase
MKKKIPLADFDELIPLLIGIWRRFHKLSGPADVLQTREFRGVVAAVQKLQKGLEMGTELIGQDYFSDPDLLGAYLLYQWIIHYQQGLSLINEIPHTPTRVLDIGSGPAPFAFAALRHGAKEVIAMDQNQTALRLGAEVCGRYGFPLKILHHRYSKGPLPVEGKFDLIIMGHCLQELVPQGIELQLQFIQHLLSLLTPTGFLLLVDSSLLAANRRILILRDLLVKKGVPVQAPCIWQGECPALQTKDSPCYAQRDLEKPYLIKEIQRANQINLGSLKMSYLILKNPESSWPELPSKPLYRVISPPVESYQGKRYYLCGTGGKKNLGSHLSAYPADSRAFEYLRRGELISIEGALEKPHSLDIIEGTQLKVEAATGKPIPEFFEDELKNGIT